MSLQNNSNKDNEIHYPKGDYSKTCFICDVDYKNLEVKNLPFRYTPHQKDINQGKKPSNDHIFRFMICPYCDVIFETYQQNKEKKIKYVTGQLMTCKSIDKKDIEQYYMDYCNSTD